MAALMTDLAIAEAMDRFVASDGRTLRELSDSRPTLLLFLRHSGCPFCKEAVADIAKVRQDLEGNGCGVALVLQGDEDDAQRLLVPAGLPDVPFVLDPERALFRAFELKRGNLWQIAGPYVWWRVFRASLAGHRVGRAVGDPFQMPGAFVIHKGRVVRAHRHRSQAERPDYRALACPLPER